MKTVKTPRNLLTQQLSFAISTSTYAEQDLETDRMQKTSNPDRSQKVRNLEGGNILITQKNVRNLLDQFAANALES
jgi:hypothetical protein